MDDYISRKWISDAIHNFFCGLKHSVTEEDIQAYISATPIADVRENIHGHWIDKGDGVFQCSICGKVELWEGVFCASCGADMREDQNE